MKKSLIQMLQEAMPIKIEKEVDLTGENIGLAIIDVIKGFCEFGNLASKGPAIDQMINLTDKLAEKIWHKDGRILVLLDTHKKGVLERPYPPHREEGTGEENLVDKLAWLLDPAVSPSGRIDYIRKNCINGYIGGVGAGSVFAKVDQVGVWIDNLAGPDSKSTSLIVTGICTDICVLQFVQTVLSARNHGLLPYLKDVIVYTEACATYDLPLETALKLGLPKTAAHPRDEAQHIGLYLMQQSGAILAKNVKI